MTIQPSLFVFLTAVALCAQAQADTKVNTVFSVNLESKADPSKTITIELYSAGVDGLFVRVDGKAIGKVAVIDVDPKFRFKRYFATVWEDGSGKLWSDDRSEFGFSLEHETKLKDGVVESSHWKLNFSGEKYAAAKPKITTFPQAASTKHMVLMQANFWDKAGGLRLSDLSSLFYPLPIEPYDTPGKVTRREDLETGLTLVNAKFSVTSRIPTEHILAYIRATTLTTGVSVAFDLKDQ